MRAGGELRPDLAWAYDYPTRQLLPIAGLVAFYHERVDVHVDGARLTRPVTHFSRASPWVQGPRAGTARSSVRRRPAAPKIHLAKDALPECRG